MAAPMWRMNGVWRRLAGVLVLCTLLLSSEFGILLHKHTSFDHNHISSTCLQLGVRRPPSSSPPSSSSGSSVFVGVLVSGLLAAIAITLGYCKCQRRSDPKGVRLAEEAYPVDQENQGNTLVSVAPLNPPAETQEKPSVNGESTEAAKTQPPPPTNGHPATKTADTEM
uniref:Uncharacterized protein n=1 Tax=Mola mola TaxID=94237 RepID=A0A3Q4BPB3_MOLML